MDCIVSIETLAVDQTQYLTRELTTMLSFSLAFFPCRSYQIRRKGEFSTSRFSTPSLTSLTCVSVFCLDPFAPPPPPPPPPNLHLTPSHGTDPRLASPAPIPA